MWAGPVRIRYLASRDSGTQVVARDRAHLLDQLKAEACGGVSSSLNRHVRLSDSASSFLFEVKQPFVFERENRSGEGHSGIRAVTGIARATSSDKAANGNLVCSFRASVTLVRRSANFFTPNAGVSVRIVNP
jgi:hypothetical protein